MNDESPTVTTYWTYRPTQCCAYSVVPIHRAKLETHSEPREPSSSDWVVSSSDWSPRRSHGKIAAESAISRTGAMLGRRLPDPFSAGRASLLLLLSGGFVFWRSMATVPVTRSIGPCFYPACTGACAANMSYQSLHAHIYKAGATAEPESRKGRKNNVIMK